MGSIGSPHSEIHYCCSSFANFFEKKGQCKTFRDKFATTNAAFKHLWSPSSFHLIFLFVSLINNLSSFQTFTPLIQLSCKCLNIYRKLSRFYFATITVKKIDEKKFYVELNPLCQYYFMCKCIKQ